MAGASRFFLARLPDELRLLARAPPLPRPRPPASPPALRATLSRAPPAILCSRPPAALPAFLPPFPRRIPAPSARAFSLSAFRGAPANLGGGGARGPLPQPPPDPAADGNAADTVAVKERKLVFSEAGTIVRLAAPISGAYLISMASQFTSMFYLGHLGATELAAAAMAIMYCNVTGYSIIIGLATSLDTLCAQTFTSPTARPGALGVLMQRGWVLLLLVTLPVAYAWLNAERVLLYLGQEADVARLAGDYARTAIVALIPLAISEPVKRFLQAQQVMRAATYASLLALSLTFPLNYLLVSPAVPFLTMGFHGAPVVYALVSWANAGFLLVYARRFSGVWKGAWAGFDGARVFTRAGFAALLALGLPGVLQVGAEWWAWEVSSLMSGWLGTRPLAAQSVLITVTTVTYCIPLGLAVAASVRVGNHLGAGRAALAKAASRAAILLAGTFGFANAAFLHLTRRSWGPFLTSDTRVSDAVAETLPLAALFQVNDGFSAVGGGVMRGCGYQGLGAAYAVLGFYVLGLPAGYWLAFRSRVFGDPPPAEEVGAERGEGPDTGVAGGHGTKGPAHAAVEGEGLKGIWRGLSLGLFIMSVLQTRFVLGLDMGKEAARAAVRTSRATQVRHAVD
ncbi:mate-domain-containing protein [Hyaloraphidium curvatum]|nr:mate-domain-containing protein [Hyaloraphidium curvatum]